jgi:hypothetical protein
MRLSATLIACGVLLAGCEAKKTDEAEAAPAAEKTPTRAANGNELIECAIGGAQWFLRECEVEKSEDDKGAKVLVVHHPDGGFRRFTVMTDGSGLATTDGAVEADGAIVEDRLDVRVGDDRYRFPATVKPKDAPGAPGQ